MSAMKIAILTGGGDAPGLNGIIEAAGKTLLRQGHQVYGILNGFEGIFNSRIIELNEGNLEGLHAKAGTLLGSSNRTGTQDREKEFLDKYKELDLNGLLVAGGDGTFAGLKAFREQIPIIGAPKTIDNDIPGTDISFGYDTACTVVAESADALRATADAHSRIMIVEVMGRTAGWIALGGGIASQSEVILLPERPFDFQALCKFLNDKKAKGRKGLIIVVAEGASEKNSKPEVAFEVEGSPQSERYGGIAELLARRIERETAWESRHVVLGHLQRSRPPTTTDRFLTIAMGVEMARMVAEGDWNRAVVYKDGRVRRDSIDVFMTGARLVPDDHRWVGMAQALGLYI